LNVEATVDKYGTKYETGKYRQGNRKLLPFAVWVFQPQSLIIAIFPGFFEAM